MKIREREFQLGNCILAAKAWGDERDFPILALHGWLDNAASFDSIAPHLVEAGYYLLTVDLPGHGLSGQCEYEYLFTHYFDILNKLRLQLSWTNYVILGHSFGAAIGSILASCFSNEVSAAIFIDAIGPLSAEMMGQTSHLASSINRITKRGSNHITYYPNIDKAIKARVKGSRISLDSATILAKRGVEQTEKGYFWAFDRKLLQPSSKYLSEEDIQCYFRQISCPVLLLRAQEGILKDNKFVNQRIECLRNLTLINIDGHHHLHMETPEQVSQQICQFLKTLAA